MNQIYTPTVGSDIFTADREKLGAVKEVRGNYFKVDAPMQPDYWLPARQIVDIEDGQVRLGFVNEELSLHKLAEPTGT